MITEAQRQEYIARGYDIIFERSNQVFVVNSQGVSSWDDEKKEKFCNATGLEIFFEKDGNPVFYDPEYFEIQTNGQIYYLHYIGTAESNIPQPINCHSMDCMFYECNSLQSLDLSDWDVSNVTDMSDMFNSCTALQPLDLSTWDVSNVTNMSGMFCDCESFQSLDLSTWDVSNVTDIGFMFAGCKSLQAPDLGTWNVSNVITMESMFEDCEALQSLDLSTWNVSTLEYTACMFYKCESLQQTYGMTDDELEEALRSGNWSALPAKQSNDPQKINF